MDRLFNRFCIRVLFMLVVLLFGTLVVQHFLNLRAERQSTEQTKALIAGLTLGVKGISSVNYLYELRNRTNEPSLDRIANVLIVDERLRVRDSLDKQYIPVENSDYDPSEGIAPENERLKYVLLRDVADLPQEKILTLNVKDEVNLLLPANTAKFTLNSKEPRAFVVPITGQTNGKREVTWYVIVVMNPQESLSIAGLQTVKPLLYMASAFLFVCLMATFLVRKFSVSSRDALKIYRRPTLR